MSNRSVPFDILRHSNELANLLNTELELTEPITPNNLKYIDAQFITDSFHSKDSDLICEVENKDNIFLIEHQSTVNSIMPIRILNYTKELVREISQGERCNKTITPINEQKILSNYANGLLLSIVNEDRVKEFVENISEEECDESMFLLPERVKIWYNEDIAKATNDGISKGRAEGMAEGIAKGRTNELLKLAKKMIKDKMDIELIKRYTGYSTKQIEELKKSMS